MARKALRRLLERALGAPGRALVAWRTRGLAEALLARRGLARPAAELAARLDDRVRRGPFEGMHYPRRRGDIVHLAKLVGGYECELHAVLDRLLARAPHLVVNVGSGDGYYVVGCARRLGQARLIAVDPDPLAQRAAADTARRNGVGDRIERLTRVDAAGLEVLLQRSPAHPQARAGGTETARDGSGRALCLVDCEGFEDELLDPVRAPHLAWSDLLVETHDFARPGVTMRLTDRFAPTHDVERIEVTRRDPRDFPELAALPAELVAGLLDEFRHLPQSWLACTARQR